MKRLLIIIRRYSVISRWSQKRQSRWGQRKARHVNLLFSTRSEGKRFATLLVSWRFGKPKSESLDKCFQFLAPKLGCIDAKCNAAMKAGRVVWQRGSSHLLNITHHVTLSNAVHFGPWLLKNVVSKHCDTGIIKFSWCQLPSPEKSEVTAIICINPHTASYLFNCIFPSCIQSSSVVVARLRNP